MRGVHAPSVETGPCLRYRKDAMEESIFLLHLAVLQSNVHETMAWFLLTYVTHCVSAS